MKKNKLTVTAAVCILLIAFIFNAGASPLYSASLKLGAASDKSGIIYVNVNEKVSVSLDLTTSKGYYAGPFSTPVFYTDSVFSAGSPKLNTSGRFYNCCKTYTSALNYDKLSAEAVNALYPESWSAQKIRENKLIYTVMVPNKGDCSFTPDELNEKLWTAEFTVKNAVGLQGKIFIPSECIRSEENIGGATYLARYSDNGNISSKKYDYGSDMNIDVSQAEITYQVTDKADVNNDQRISSADALLILQHSVKMIKLDDSAFARADLTKNNKIGADDALAILYIATGITTIDNYMH